MAIDNIKIRLGDAAENFTDPQITLAQEEAQAEIKDYCRVDELDSTLLLVADRVAVIKLNRMNSEGLASQGYSGVSESYIDGYPADIKAILNNKRRIKVL